MEPLCGPVYRSLDGAVEVSWRHFDDHDMSDDEFSSGRWNLARAHARRLLIREQVTGDLGNWKLSKPRPNIQVSLHLGATKLRILRPVEDEPPPPGPTRARVAYFANYGANLFGVDGSNFVGLWSRNRETDEVELRVVRPRGRWRWGERAKVDLNLLLPRRADELDQLEFRPNDEDIALPFDGDLMEGNDNDASGYA